MARQSKELRKLIRDTVKHSPKTPKELRALGYSVQRAGHGAYRQAYSVADGVTLVDTGAIVKFPHSAVGETPCTSNPCATEQITHAQMEVEALQKVMRTKRLRPLRRYMPEIYAFNARAGVTLVKKYKQARYNASLRWFVCFFDALVNDLLDLKWELDSVPKNIGWDGSQYTLLDLGLLEE